jgi:hypothetical protein
MCCGDTPALCGVVVHTEEVRKERRKQTKHDNAVRVASLLNDVSTK